MKRNGSKSFGYATAASSLILLLFLSGPAWCQEDGTALMLQLSPADGGRVNLEPGVHKYERDAQVTLSAIPNPGYQFVYWMGNVTEATASTTTVLLDGPKIVIAVFERAKFDIIPFEEKPEPSGGGGGLYRSRVERGTDASGVIVYRPPSYHPPHVPHRPPVPEDQPGQPPVPGDNSGENPVPPDNQVPEPATILFLAAGMFALTCKRRGRSGRIQ